MKKVLIVQKSIAQYRQDFYFLLKDDLLKYDIELQIIYGKNKNQNALKNDEVDIEWATYIPSKIIKIWKIELVWQPILNKIRDKDLVIVESANKLLINYYLIIARKFLKYKLGFWGHGRNLQNDMNSWQNKFKYLFLNKCDWWFGYTTGTKNFLRLRNFPLNRITVVQNTIDTNSLKIFYSNITKNEIFDLQNELGIGSSLTAIFCGALYPQKNFDFILETCYRVKNEIPEFQMIFIGSGIEAKKIIEASKTNEWIHYVGSKFGKERVKYFKTAHIQLMPYYVGLGIVDSFALETPLITTLNGNHGPEIEYLENGVNGITTNNNIDEYSQKVIDVLKNKTYLDLIEGCKSSAIEITVEKMASNFKEGIIECLSF